MNRSRSICFFGMMIMVLCLVSSPPAQEKQGAEELYTIKQGDTLWEISSKFLKDPFLWPKLWQRNPYITNPHWIYPGHPIRLSPIEEVKQEEAQKEKPREVAAEEKPKEVAKEPEGKKVEPVSPAPIEKKAEEQLAEKKPAENKPVEKKPAEKKPLVFSEARTAGFFSDIDYKGIGIVLESKEGKSIMATGDILYGAFRASESISVGDKYTVFRASKLISHPVTDKKIGRRYNIIADIQIIDQNGSFFTAKIIESFDGMRKGDMIRPYLNDKTEGEGIK